jgi:hypothetical protein
MPLTMDQIQDIAKSTLPDFGKNKLTDLMSDLQDHIAMGILKERKSLDEADGESIKINVLTKNDGNARHTGAFAQDATDVVDGLQVGEVPFRVTTTSWAIDKLFELEPNRSNAAKIVDLFTVRRAQAISSLEELLESAFWGKPTDSNDKVTPWGLKMWIVRNATKGFNGGNPDGFTSGVAGLDSTTLTRWRNFSGTYTNVSRTDLIRTWREASMKCLFKPVVDLQKYAAAAPKYGFYAPQDTVLELEEIVQAQNDNLGPDIASYFGGTLFRRIPVTPVPYLDADSGDPIYGIDWSVFRVKVQRGNSFVETPLEKAPNQHNVLRAFVDTMWNIACADRRRLFVLYKS